MKTLIELKAKAIQETKHSLHIEVERVRQLSLMHPQGYDLTVPKQLTELIAEMCDKEDIPCYVLMEGTISTAGSYTALYKHERNR